MKNDFDKTLAEGRRRFQKMTKKGSKNDVLAPPFWGYTGQNGQKRPFLTPGGGSHTPGGGSHTPKFGGGPPPRTRIGASRLFRVSMFYGNVQTSFAEICTNMFWQFLRDYFVKDLWKICSEILQKRWWQIDRWLDRLLENICGRLCARFDRWPIDNSSTTLWEICGRHIWQKYLRDTRE